MELTTKTFSEGMKFLQECYPTQSFRSFNKTWYEVIKLDISDEEFMPLIIQYCRTESAVPTCPADIINFKLKK